MSARRELTQQQREVLEAFVEHFRVMWDLATTEEAIDQILFEWSDAGRDARVARVLEELP